MKSKFKKTIKIISLVLLITIFIGIIFSSGFYIFTTANLSLNTDKLAKSTSLQNLKILDINGNKLVSEKDDYIKLSKLSSNTTNAFICAEDKRFYRHSGLDYVRIGGAIVSNLKSGSFSQGASTISQQLVKNTQLSNEKTLKRKLKEMKLTKQLEKKYSKSQILEMYLNTIYFGNGCYGIENASKHYFNKSASNLTLAESALLAGTINAPSVYDIEDHQDKAVKRRDLILSLMKQHKKISQDEYNSAVSDSINLNLTKLKNNEIAYNNILKEACKILKTTENQIKNKDIKIHTSINQDLQNKLCRICQNYYSKLPTNISIATIVIDKNSGNIISLTGKNSDFSSKKQPGSTIKPILVYAPGFEKNIISPATKILDQKIDISGYSPENADKKYHGYVSVREALKNSYNIPAVKLLNEIGITDAQNFAKKMGLTFEKSDHNLATALGALTNGVSLKNLADCYLCFSNLGKYKPSSLISKIEYNGKIIYENQNSFKSVMNESTAYLITDILKDCTKTGTAKRLKDFPFEIASKTGTVGKQNSTNNTDAYNISYTSEHVIFTYIGADNMQSNINGSTYPTMISKEILQTLYSNHLPKSFKTPSSVVKLNLNKQDYDNNKLTKSDNSKDSIMEVFSKNNLPNNNDKFPNLNLDVFNFKNQKPILCFSADENHIYNIHRINKNKEEIISSLENVNSSKIIKFSDNSAKNNEIYEYFVEICDKSSDKTYKTNKIKLRTF